MSFENACGNTAVAPRPAIRVHHLQKRYRLYDSTISRLKEWLWRPFNRALGRELPPFYRSFTALDDVSLDIWPQQTVGVIGRNGSGKSTLLQLISGTLFASRGEVEVNGRVAALLELGAGFNPEFTGRENVYIYAAVMGLSREQVSARFEAIAAFADIGAFIDQPVKAYSSGMLVRLAFAVIAHVDADILIIDEALAVGDAFFVQKCMRFLRGFMAHGTVLFVSHDSAAVTSLCDSAVWLDGGRVKMTGSAKDVAEAYLEARFEGDAPSDDAVPQANYTPPPDMPAVDEDYHDMRRDLVLASTLRNDLQVLRFDATGGSFGDAGATITHAALHDRFGRPLNWVVGGEPVELQIACRASIRLERPIVGFFVKDRLGQTLFGDNTYLATSPRPVEAGGTFTARFTFRMPILPADAYSVGMSVADGTQLEHVQHHWLHDAIIIHSHASQVATGLVGVPMHHIALAPAPASTREAPGRL